MATTPLQLSTVNHSIVIPTVWEPMFEFTANQPRGLAERVWNISDRVQGSGNTYNLTILPAYAPTAPTGTAPDQSFASGNVMTWVGDDSTKQANYVTVGTPTQKQIKFRLNNIAIKLDPDIQTFSVSDLAEAYTPVLAESLYQAIELELFYLIGNTTLWPSNATFEIGTDATPFSEANFLSGLGTLLTNAKDKLAPGDSEIFAVYDLNQIDNVLNVGNIVNASVRGEKNGAAMTGRIKTVYGVDFMFTGNVPTQGAGNSNFLFARKAMAYGRKSNAKIETDRQDLITKIIAHCIWGANQVHQVLGFRHLTN